MRWGSKERQRFCRAMSPHHTQKQRQEGATCDAHTASNCAGLS